MDNQFRLEYPNIKVEIICRGMPLFDGISRKVITTETDLEIETVEGTKSHMYQFFFFDLTKDHVSIETPLFAKNYL